MRPRVGDNIYVEANKPRQPNGKIYYIDWGCDKEISVLFFDGSHGTVEWHDCNYFNERLNQWVVP